MYLQHRLGHRQAKPQVDYCSGRLIIALQKYFLLLQAENHSVAGIISNKSNHKNNFIDCPFSQRLTGRYSVYSPSLEDHCLPAPLLSPAALEVQQCPEKQITK